MATKHPGSRLLPFSLQNSCGLEMLLLLSSLTSVFCCWHKTVRSTVEPEIDLVICDLHPMQPLVGLKVAAAPQQAGVLAQ
jgi:hypothetical protein